jgi:hypothetical protein
MFSFLWRGKRPTSLQPPELRVVEALGKLEIIAALIVVPAVATSRQ